MELTDKIKKLLSDDPVLNRICMSKHFMMRQTSDVIDENLFDHVAFVGTDPIESILSNKFGLEDQVNTVVVDAYLQLFISEEEFQNNKSAFKNERNGVNYSVVPHYDEVFKGFVRTQDYFILLNSENFDHKYGVYILIDGNSGDKYIGNTNKKITFFGFINIGYLIDPLGYTEEQLVTFESKVGFTIPPLIRSRLEHTSIINYKLANKLFHIDLINFNESVKGKYKLPTKSFTNSAYIKELRDNKNEESIKKNKTFIDSMKNGFLYLGLINKISVPMDKGDNVDKRCDEIYLLMNFEEQRGIDFSFTIWQYTMMNNNAEKVLNIYSDVNQGKSLEELENMEKQHNIHDPAQIIYSMKYLENI